MVPWEICYTSTLYVVQGLLLTLSKIEQARLLKTNAAMLSTSLVKAEHTSLNSSSHGTSLALTNQGAQPAPVKLSTSNSQPLPAAQLFMPAISVTPRTPIAQSVSIEKRTPVVTTASVVRQGPCGPTLLVSQQAQASLMAPVAVFAPVAQAAETKPPVVVLPATRVMQPVPEAQSLLQKPGEVVKPLVAAPDIRAINGEAVHASPQMKLFRGVHCDATIAFPLLVSQTFAKKINEKFRGNTH